jgi:CheY-like chemotaxis protein
MPEHLAMMVEDDPDQAEVSASVLRDAGFRVIEHNFLESALKYLEETEDLIDLFVLDRRLPMRRKETATDEFGDAFFVQVRSKFPDARVIVFTGYASVDLLQEAMQGSGQFPLRMHNPIDRITVLKKDQSLEFKQHVQSYRALLQELDDIELHDDTTGRDFTTIDRRLLRRVAYEFGAVSITPTSLGGGLTGARVWKCAIHRVEGHVADIVAKQVEKPQALGGLEDLLPLHTSASTRASISGLIAGHSVAILRLAGSSVFPLSKLITADTSKACDHVKQIATALDDIDERPSTIQLRDLVDPILEWDKLVALLTSHGIVAPSATMRMTVKMGIRHGDLHPSNIMINNDAAVLIDFDNSCFGAGLLDPVTLLVSTLVHPDSPIRGSAWPSAEEIIRTFGTDEFGLGNESAEWFRTLWQWTQSRQTSVREFWGVTLGYAGRQLKYPDVLADGDVLHRVEAVARKAADVLRSS